MKTEITVYGAPWCPSCRQLRVALAKHGVAHGYVDVDERPDLMPAGYTSLPVVVFADGYALAAPTPQQVMKHLAED